MKPFHALLAAGAITAAVAFVLGVGARSGAFGFGGSDVSAGVAAPVLDAPTAQADQTGTAPVIERRGRERRVERQDDRPDAREHDDDDDH